MTHSVKRALALLLALLLAVPTFAFAEPLDNDFEIAYEEEVETVDTEASVDEVEFDLSAMTEAEPEAPPAEEAAEDEEAEEDAEVELDLDEEAVEEEATEEETSDEATQAQDSAEEKTLEELEEETSEQEASDEAAMAVSETDVAKIGTQGYEKLGLAIDAAIAAKGATIVLLQNISTAEADGLGIIPQITEDVELVLDGHTITTTGAFATVANGGKLTVDGTVEKSAIVGSFTVNEGTLVLNGGSYETTSNDTKGTLINANDDSAATIEVTGAKLKAVNGSVIEAKNDNVTVTASEITGKNGIVVDGGSLAVSLTSIEVTEYDGITLGNTVTATLTGNAVNAARNAVGILAMQTTAFGCTATINGGTYKGGNDAIKVDVTAGNGSTVDLKVYDATVESTNGNGIYSSTKSANGTYADSVNALTLRGVEITAPKGHGIALAKSTLAMTESVINAGNNGISISESSKLTLGAGNDVTGGTYAIYAEDNKLDAYSTITAGTYKGSTAAVKAKYDEYHTGTGSGYTTHHSRQFITGGLFSSNLTEEAAEDPITTYYTSDYTVVQSGALWKVIANGTPAKVEVTDHTGENFTVKVTPKATGTDEVTPVTYNFRVYGIDSAFGVDQISEAALVEIVETVIGKLSISALSTATTREVRLAVYGVNAGTVSGTTVTYTLQPYAVAYLDMVVADSREDIRTSQLAGPTVLKLDVSGITGVVENSNMKVNHSLDGYIPESYYKKADSNKRVEVSLPYFGTVAIALESANEAYIFNGDTQVGSAAYTLADALTSKDLEKGYTIRLAKDVPVAGDLQIVNGLSFILDLNGYSLTTADGVFIDNNTKVELVSDGDGYGYVKGTNGSAIHVGDGSSLKISGDNVTVEGDISSDGTKGVVLTAGRYSEDVNADFYDAKNYTVVKNVTYGSKTYNVLSGIYTLTYMTNGFEAHSQTFNFVEGVPASAMFNPDDGSASSSFVGWYLDEACEDFPVTEIEPGVQFDVTVYGKFNYRYYAYLANSSLGEKGYFESFKDAAQQAVNRNMTLKLLRAPEKDDVFTMPKDTAARLRVNLGKVENVTLPTGAKGDLDAVEIATEALAANVKAPDEYTLNAPSKTDDVITFSVNDAVAFWTRTVKYDTPDEDHKNGTYNKYLTAFEDALAAVNEADVEDEVTYTNVEINVMQQDALTKSDTIVHNMKITGVSKLDFGEGDNAYTLTVAANTQVTVDGDITDHLLGTDNTSTMVYAGKTYTWNATTRKWMLSDAVAVILDQGGNMKLQYGSLAEAVAAAEEGETVQVVREYNPDGTLKPMTADITNEKEIQIAKNDVTVDLNGATVDSNVIYTFRVAKGVTGAKITNGKIANHYTSASSRALYVLGDVTLENLIVNTAATANGAGTYSITVAAGGKLTIATDDVVVNSAPTYTTGDDAPQSIQKVSGATCVIEKGYFENKNISELLGAGYSANLVNAEPTPALPVAVTGLYHIKAATVAVALGDGTMAGYATLQEALNAVGDYTFRMLDSNSTVKPSTITINEKITTEANVTLPATLANVTITAKEDADAVVQGMKIVSNSTATAKYYDGVTFSGIDFNNSAIEIGTTAFASTDVNKAWTIKNCEFTNMVDNTIAVKFPTGANGLTFTGNKIDSGVTGFEIDGGDGKFVITNNTIKDVSGVAMVVKTMGHAEGTAITITGNELTSTGNAGVLDLEYDYMDVLTVKDNVISSSTTATTPAFVIANADTLAKGDKTVLDVSDNYLGAMPLTLVDTLTAKSIYTKLDRTKAPLVAKILTKDAPASAHKEYTYYNTLEDAFKAAEKQYEEDKNPTKDPRPVYMVSDEETASAAPISVKADIVLHLNDCHILSQIAVQDYYSLTVEKGDDAALKNTGLFENVPTKGTTKSDLFLKAGNYYEDVQQYCYTGYFASENTTGVWTVINDPVAKIGNAYFATLQKALEYNETVDGGEIELVVPAITGDKSKITLAKGQTNLTLTKPVKLVNALDTDGSVTVSIETAGPVIFGGGLSVGEGINLTVTKSTGAASGLVTVSGGASDIAGTVDTTAVGLTISGAATVVNMTGTLNAGALTLADGAEFNATGKAEYDRLTDTRKDDTTGTPATSRIGLTATAVRVTETAASDAISKLNLKDINATFDSLVVDNTNGAQAAIALNDAKLTVSGQISLGTTGRDQADTLTLTNKSTLINNEGTTTFTVNTNDVYYTDTTSQLQVYRWVNDGKAVVDMAYVPETLNPIVTAKFELKDTVASIGAFEFSNNDDVIYEAHASGTAPACAINVGTVVATLSYYDKDKKEDVIEKYLTVADALAHTSASHDEDSIVLLQNAVLNAAATVNSKKLTFDLGGKTLKITGAGQINLANGVNATFQGGTIDVSEPTTGGANNSVFALGTGVNSLTLDNVKLNGTNVMAGTTTDTKGVFESAGGTNSLVLNNTTVTLNDWVNNTATATRESTFINFTANDTVEMKNSTVSLSNFNNGLVVGEMTVDASTVSIYSANLGIAASGAVTVKNASRVNIDSVTTMPLTLTGSGAVSVEDTSGMPLSKVKIDGGNLANLSYAPEAIGPYAAVLTASTTTPSASKTYTTYNDLTTAVAAAKEVTANEVALIRDQSTDKQVTIDLTGLTFDLCGKVYTYTGAASPAITVSGSATNKVAVTFKDSSAASTGTVATEVAYAVEVSAYADLTVEGGNYGGTVGDINGKDVHIEGGNFRHAIDPSQICADPAHTGTASTDKHGTLQASGSGNVDYPNTVADKAAVARIGANSYASLDTAIDAANSMGGSATIELMKNVSLSANKTMNYNVTLALGADVKDATVDLNGYMLTVKNGLTVAKDIEFITETATLTGAQSVVFEKGVSTINGELNVKKILVKDGAELDVGKTGEIDNSTAVLTLEKGATFAITGSDENNSTNALSQIELTNSLSVHGLHTISLTNADLTVGSIVRPADEQIALTLDNANLTVSSTGLELAGDKNNETTKPILADSLTLKNGSTLDMSAGTTTVLSLDKLDTVNIDLGSQIKVDTWTNPEEDGGVVTVDVSNPTDDNLAKAVVDTANTVTVTGKFVFTNKSVTVNNFMQYVKDAPNDTDIWVNKAAAVIYRKGVEYKYYLTLQAAITDAQPKDEIYLVNDITMTAGGVNVISKSDITIDGQDHTIKVAPISTAAPVVAKFTDNMVDVTGTADAKTNLLLQNVTLTSDTALDGNMITSDANSNVTLNNVTLDNAKADATTAYDLVDVAGNLAISGKFAATLGEKSKSVIALTGTAGKTDKEDKNTKTYQTLDLSGCTEFTIVKDDSVDKYPTIQDKFLNTAVDLGSLKFVRVYGVYTEADATATPAVTAGYNDYKTGWELSDSAKLGNATLEGTVYNYKVGEAYYTTFAGAVEDAKNTENPVEMFKDIDLTAINVDKGVLEVKATTLEKDTVTVAKNGHEPVLQAENLNVTDGKNYSIHAETEGELTTYTLVEAKVQLGTATPYTYFETVEEAVAAATTDDTITLLGDVDGDVNVTSKYTITLDTAGHNIDGALNVGEATRLVVDDLSTQRSTKFSKMPVVAEDAVLSLKGGTYPEDVDAYCAGGYSSVENEDHTFTVRSTSDMAKVMRGGELLGYYASFEAALRAATQDDDEIVLVKAGNTITEQVVLALGSTRDLTIDLNGYDLTDVTTAVNPLFDVKGNGTLTIKNTTNASSSNPTNPENAKIVTSGNVATTIRLSDYANLTVEGGAITGSVIAADGKITTGANIAVDNTSSGTVTVNGGQLHGKDNGILTDINKTGKIIVTGGEVIGDTDYAIRNRGTSKITVTGGCFKSGVVGTTTVPAHDIENNLGDNQNLTTVTGGNFAHEVPELQAPGYISSKNIDAKTQTDYPFTVVQGEVVAKIGVYSFTSVKDAVAAATAGANRIVIVAEADEVDMGEIEVAKTVTIDMNRKTLNGSFTVNGGSLTLEEGVLNNPEGDGVVIMARSANTDVTPAVTRANAAFTLDSKSTINAKNAIVLSGKSLKDETHTGGDLTVGITIEGIANGAVIVEKGTTSVNTITIGADGAINNENGAGLTLLGAATVTLQNGTNSGAAITGSTMGIDLQAGTVNTVGGSSVTGGDYGVKVTYGDTSDITLNIDGGRFAGNTALYVENQGTRKNDHVNVTVSSANGGTFVAGNGEAIQVVDTNKELTTVVNNGYFSKPIANEIVVKGMMSTQKKTMKVTGETADFYYLVQKLTLTLNPGGDAEAEKKAYFVDKDGNPIIDEQTGDYASKTVYVAKGETVDCAVPSDLPVLEGYYLANWLEGKNVYDPAKTEVMTDNLTMTAQWSKDRCTVIVDLAGGKYTGDTSAFVLNDDGTYTIRNVNYGTKISDLLETGKISRDNYKFQNWVNAATSENVESSAEITQEMIKTDEAGNNTLKLVANWLGNDTMIMFINNDMSKIGAGTITVPYNSSINEVEAAKAALTDIETAAKALEREGYRLNDQNLWTPELNLDGKITDTQVYMLNWIEIVYVAQVGDEKFESFDEAAEAAKAAGEDAVIELLADVEEAYVMGEDETIKVKTNDHVLAVEDSEGNAIEGTTGEDGITTFTTVPVTVEAVWKPTLNLQDKIGMRLRIQLPEGEDPAAYSIKYEYKSNYQTVSTTKNFPAKTSAYQGEQYYNLGQLVDCGSDEMMDTLTVTLLKSGEEVEKKEYTIASIADEALKTAEGAQATMYKALKQYGYYAQVYFGTNTDKLPNKDGAPALVAIPDSYKPAAALEVLPSMKAIRATLALDSSVDLNFIITPADGYTVADFKFEETVLPEHEKDLGTPVVRKSGQIAISLKSIFSDQMSDEYTLTITDKDGKSASYTRSLMNCAYDLQANGDQDLKNLLMALYQYHLAAKAVFA